MSDATANLLMPTVANGQGIAEVPHNEALTELDTLVNCSVKNRTTSAPPAASTGDRYIPKATASGVWTGYENKIAVYVTNQWKFYTPVIGWITWVENEKCFIIWDGTSWKSYAGEARFAAYDHSTTQSLTGSFAGLPFDTETKTNAQVFTHSTSSNKDQITLLESGDYEVIAQITLDYTSGTTAICQGQLSLNGTGITGTLTYMFASSTVDKTTWTIHAIFTAVANDVLRVEAKVTSGGADITVDCTRVAVRRV